MASCHMQNTVGDAVATDQIRRLMSFHEDTGEKLFGYLFGKGRTVMDSED